METTDFIDASGQQVDRLTAVKQVLDDFLARRRGDRVGLIFFGSAAFVQAPFTQDLDALRALLDEAQVRMAGPKTAFGDAIGLALTVFEHDPGVRDRVLIALTDGNDTGSDVPPARAAEIARDRGITIHTVAVGDPTAAGEERLDEETLRAVATTTGGQYSRANDRAALAAIYARLDAPPGTEGLRGLISTSELTVREEWQPRPGDRARVGDAFLRTVTRTAPDVPGMVLPPLPLAEVEGLAAYPSPAVVRDRVECGDFTGERVERITYVCEHPGRAVVPTLRMPWWNAASRAVETATLPAVTLRIGGAPVPGGRWWLVGLGVVLAVMAAAVAWRRRDVLRHAWRRRRARREAGEAGSFARLERAPAPGTLTPRMPPCWAGSR